MTDYLLKFLNQEEAMQFGLANGFVRIDKSGETEILLATHQYALSVIGQHNEKDWWVLFRDLANIPVPEGSQKYIIWSSKMVDQEGNPIPRPTEDPNIPNTFWC